MSSWNLLRHELEEAQTYASRNYQELTRGFPERLALEEDRLPERIRNTKGGPLKKLEVLYAFMDKLQEYVSKFTPCRKRCNHCCRNDELAITEVEIRYIENATGSRRAPSAIQFRESFGVPSCPFLTDDGCSIYRYRPFLCRRHFSLCETPIWCSSDRNNLAEFPLLAFTGVDEAYAFIVMKSGSAQSVRDIREVFASSEERTSGTRELFD
jgi:uncharacterized protein